MNQVTTPALLQAQQAFDFGGETLPAVRYGAGHINDTYLVQRVQDGKRFILQRINTATFHDYKALMHNVLGVTGHLRRKILAAGGDPERETLNVILARDGEPYFVDEAGGVWRSYAFIENTVCLQKVESEQDFYTSAVAFGRFMQQLADYPADTLTETIARFHHTPDRYAQFEAALAADVMGRAKEVATEVAFVRARKADCSVLTDLLAAGKLPLRVTHNDTKLNNILLDADTGAAVCVIDLDTVMPGLALYDFGDSIRFGANDCAEDEPDQSKVHFSLRLFEVYTRGYLAAAGSALTALEKQYLPWGAKLMTLECGIRFLTDYLQGDVYFKTERPGQNLDRARTQFTLVKGMEDVWDELHAVVERCGAQ